jgi:hypothetical protein
LLWRGGGVRATKALSGVDLKGLPGKVGMVDEVGMD